jgi:hypothetical protein
VLESGEKLKFVGDHTSESVRASGILISKEREMGD